MKKERIHIRSLVIISGLIILSLISLLDVQLQEYIKYNEVQEYYLYRTLVGLLLISFGLLIEHEKVISIFRNGTHLNVYYLIGSVVLIILLMIPLNVGIEYSSSLKGTALLIINSTSTRSVLGILAGILLTRSFTDTRLKQEASENRSSQL